MKKSEKMKLSFVKKSITVLLATTFIACTANQPASTIVSPPADIVSAASELLNKTKIADGILVADKGDDPAKYFDGGVVVGEQAQKNIETFDELDYEVFSNQDWMNLHKSHADNIVVSWPDGHDTYGIERHIEDLKWLFLHAPDTRIKVHPVKVAAGNWTAVHGIMEGTFTEPMKLADGSEIQPTGKKFSIPMATFAVWKDGVMIHEWLFWDNQTYMNQMGIGQ